MTESTEILFQDLERNRIEGASLERNASMSVTGLGEIKVPILVQLQNGERRVIGIHGPLTPDLPADSMLHELQEYTSIPVILVDELDVRRNLPRVTSDLLSTLSRS
jgi:uncharacterized protein (UPF0216 family)